MPLSLTSRQPSGTLLAQTQRVVQIGLEGAQVAIVDADQRGAGVEHARQIRRLVQVRPAASVPIRCASLCSEPQVAVVETFGDQQHRVGAGRAGFEQLIARRE